MYSTMANHRQTIRPKPQAETDQEHAASKSTQDKTSKADQYASRQRALVSRRMAGSGVSQEKGSGFDVMRDQCEEQSGGIFEGLSGDDEQDPM